MHPIVYFDITGGCNAKCPLCSTARLTFGQRIEYVPVPKFAKALDRLFELGLMDASSTVSLYNWGEPILHPDLNGIVQALNDRSLRVGFSTNGSKKSNFRVSTKNLTEVYFSIPGFSQASYDKVHGLKFERVLQNIEATLGNLRETGYQCTPTLRFHVYRFNVGDEFKRAEEWAASHQMQFQSYYAYFADYQLGRQHLEGASLAVPASVLAPDAVQGLSQQLFLDYVDDLVRSQPRDWACPQWKQMLTLNHRAEVLLCCVLPNGHSAQVLGSVFDLSREQILAGKKTSAECDDCMSCGVAYWVHNPRFVSRRDLESLEPAALAV
jgi:MoaA/NifB/PqqE/SkfB family radical SAM enzyme